MKEVYPGIFLIKEPGRFNNIKPQVNVYVLAGKDGIIYDSGHGDKRSLKFFKKELAEIKKYWEENHGEFNITRIILSHAHVDHFSGLTGIQKLTGAKVLLTKKIGEMISSKKQYFKKYADNMFTHNYKTVSIFKKIISSVVSYISLKQYLLIVNMVFYTKEYDIIDDKSEIVVNDTKWSLFYSPGHASEHITFYNKDTGVLFSGDNILRTVVTWLGPPRSNITDYLESLNYIKNLENLKLILPGHGSPVLEPVKRIDEIISWRLKRTDDVLINIETFKSDGISFNQLLDAIYGNHRSMKVKMGSGWIQVTLDCLEKAGKIEKIVRNKTIYFRKI